MSQIAIPQFLENYNVYLDGPRLLGVEADATLPKLENIGDTLSGAGVLGEVEIPVEGAFKSISVETTFRTINRAMFTAASAGLHTLTFRGSQEVLDFASGGVVKQPVRVETQGMCKGIDLGKLTGGKPTDSKLTQEIIFLAVYVDNEECLLLDKINYIYRIMGVDQLAQTRSNM